ncbi:MAG: carbohydrate kinase family protein [Acidobacteria bacterium]|nr:carbohydrate kinase family protein [Acidobacteriota bacterium]
MRFPFKLKQNDADTDLDVIGFGTNAVDFLIRVPEYPAFNSKVRLSDYIRAAGGEAATTMAGLQRLGLRTSYIGRFGDDDAGEFGMASLRDEGVDLSYAEKIEGAATQIAFIVIDDRNGERTVIWDRDPKLSYSADEAPLDAVKRSKVLHFTPHDVEACIAMAKEAKEHGVIVSADIDNMFEGAEELFSYIDIFIASSDLPAKIFGPIDERKALLNLQDRFGSKLVGITLGRAGSLLLCDGKFIETPGYAVPGGCKDTTGAGDSYRVGLLYGLLTGSEIEEAAKMANAVAALKCRAVGARTSLPTKSELFEMIN